MLKKHHIDQPADDIKEEGVQVTAYVLPDGTISINNKEVMMYNAYLAQNLSSYVKVTVSPLSKEEKEKIICDLEKSRKELEEHDKEVITIQGKVKRSYDRDVGYRNKPMTELRGTEEDELTNSFYPSPDNISDAIRFSNLIQNVPEEEIDEKERLYEESVKPEDDITKGYVITNDPIKKKKQRGFKI